VATHFFAAGRVCDFTPFLWNGLSRGIDQICQSLAANQRNPRYPIRVKELLLARSAANGDDDIRRLVTEYDRRRQDGSCQSKYSQFQADVSGMQHRIKTDHPGTADCPAADKILPAFV
jgi:hypothetical protein